MILSNKLIALISLSAIFAVIFSFQNSANCQSLNFSVEVNNNFDIPIENASVYVTLNDGPNYQGTPRQQRRIDFLHQGLGKYRSRENLRLDGTYEAELTVSAANHEAISQPVYGSGGFIPVTLFHNNYYQRCNEGYGAGSSSILSFDRNSWQNCRVDPERLIETFGTEKATILNDGQNNFFEATLYKYAPDIRNDFKNFAPRYNAYRVILEQLMKSYAITNATKENRQLIEWVEQEMNENRQISTSELVVKGAEFVSDFSETFSELNTALGAIGYTFKVARAHREGNLEGILMYIAYRSSANTLVDRINSLSQKSWFNSDEAFRSALEDVTHDYERFKNLELEQVAEAVASRRIGETLSDIMYGTLIKGILAKAGVSAVTIATGSAAPAAVSGTMHIAAAYVVYDFINSVSETGHQHALLAAIAQLDRNLFAGVPDSYDPALTTSLSGQEVEDILIRLHLGVMFNEARAALYAGEYRTWIGHAFRYSNDVAKNAEQAYELKMVDMSNNKIQIALNDIQEIIASDFLNKTPIVIPPVISLVSRGTAAAIDFSIDEHVGKMSLETYVDWDIFPGICEAELDIINVQYNPDNGIKEYSVEYIKDHFDYSEKERSVIIVKLVQDDVYITMPDHLLFMNQNYCSTRGWWPYEIHFNQSIDVPWATLDIDDDYWKLTSSGTESIHPLEATSVREQEPLPKVTILNSSYDEIRSNRYTPMWSTEEMGRNILWYEISGFWEDNEDSEFFGLIKTKNTFYELTNLRNGYYEIQVRAVFDNGKRSPRGARHTFAIDHGSNLNKQNMDTEFMSIDGEFTRYYDFPVSDNRSADLRITDKGEGKYLISGVALSYHEVPNIGQFEREGYFQINSNTLQVDFETCSLTIEIISDSEIEVSDQSRVCWGHNAHFSGKYRKE